jgi:hypothetical protein
VVLLIVIGTHNSGSTPQSTTAPAASVPTLEQPSASVLAAQPAPTDPRVAISDWWTGGGQDRESAISKDYTDMGTAATATDIPGLGTACASLQSDVEAAQAYGGVPDTVAQADWSTALAQSARAATDCIAFTRNLDAGLLTQSGQELSASTAALNKVTERIKTFQSGG